MATLRLFANLRETAGTKSVDVAGTTVGEVLATAVSNYGERFAAGLETAQIWVNGEPATANTPVGDGDEIAAIPPVSGGAVAVQEADVTALALVGALVAALVIGNVTSTEALAVATVGVGVAWLWDLRDAFESRGGSVRIVPAMLAVAATGNGAYRWGTVGLAGGLALGLAVVLAWAVLDQKQRTISAIAVSLLTATTAGLGAGALVMLRLRSAAEAGAFIAIASASAIGAWLAHRASSPAGSVDPNLAALLTAVAAAAISGLVAETIDIVYALLAGVLAGGGIIAGRTIGATVRLGQILHTMRGPGLLTAFDGAATGAAIFWIALELLN